MKEKAHQNKKFPHANQLAMLLHGQLTASDSIGGHAESYWSRLQVIRQSESFSNPESRERLLLLAAQYAGKAASSYTALFAVLKTRFKDDYGGSRNMIMNAVAASISDEETKAAYRWLDAEDYYETPPGRGIAAYADRVRARGAPETNLGIAADLIRVRAICVDAAHIAVAQFNECYEETGKLPMGGTSSGEIEIWTPKSNP